MFSSPCLALRACAAAGAGVAARAMLQLAPWK
jgi:hypothetical protein